MTSSDGQKSRWSLALIALRYRNFRLVWLGSVTEHIGEFMEIAAILWLVNELTHSPLWLSVVGSCRFFSMIIFPIVGGVAADRLNRRTVLIIALLSSSALSAVLTVLAATNAIDLRALIGISVLGGVATSFNHPARHAIVPNLVNREHLLNAVSLDTMSVQISRAIGVPIAGYLMSIVGVWPIFAIRALGCLVAILWLLQARVPPTPPVNRAQAPWQNVIQGFRYLRHDTTILILVLLYAIPYLVMNTYMNFLPVFANDLLRVGTIGYGYLQGVPGLGAIICMIGLGFLTYYQGKFRLLIGSSMILATSLLLFSASIWFILSLLLLIIAGGMVTTFSAVNTTLIQGIVPDDMRGRIMAWREVIMGLGPTGSIIFGAIAQYTGVRLSLGILGAICLAVSLLLLLLLPRFRSVG